MSACDTCPAPGRCCTGLQVYGAPGQFDEAAPTALELLASLASVVGFAPDREVEELGLPFLPLYQRPNGTWRLWCPVLDWRTGRCTDYDNRPWACRSFEPASDRLCVLYEEPSHVSETDAQAGANH